MRLKYDLTNNTTMKKVNLWIPLFVALFSCSQNIDYKEAEEYIIKSELEWGGGGGWIMGIPTPRPNVQQ